MREEGWGEGGELGSDRNPDPDPLENVLDPDPDPLENVLDTDPQHCSNGIKLTITTPDIL